MLIVGSDGLLKISDLIKFDVYAKKNYNVQMEVGTKTKELLSSIDNLGNKRFEEGPTTSFYAECVKYLLTNLPLDNQALIVVNYLHPNLKSKIRGSNSLAILMETVWNCLGTSAQELFEMKHHSNISELQNQIKLQLTTFALEASIPEIYKELTIQFNALPFPDNEGWTLHHV